jgi:hypothetical protein
MAGNQRLSISEERRGTAFLLLEQQQRIEPARGDRHQGAPLALSEFVPAEVQAHEVTICCNRAAPSVPLDLLGCYGFSRDLPRNELGVSPI